MTRQKPEETGAAEVIALKALTFIAADEARFQRFINLTGLTLAEIRLRAAEPSFLAAVLGYLRNDESLLMIFAEQEDLQPAAVDRAGRRLAGEP